MLDAVEGPVKRYYDGTLLVMEDDIEEGTVHVQPAVRVPVARVTNETQIAELIQEET